MEGNALLSDSTGTTEQHTDQSPSAGVNSNISIGDIDSDVAQKLRGDAIGDTLYSESFVAKTLLQLSNLQWSDKIEEDLCFLWDMTVEKDVCEYLLQVHYPDIVCEVIKRYNEGRLIEIMIGILANVCCMIKSADIAEEQIEMVLTALSSNDSLILIQVMRFIKVVVYNSESLPFINETVMTQLNFVLLNSCNSELLLNTLDAVSKLTSDNKLKIELLKGELLKSAVVAYQTIFNTEREQFLLDEDQLETNMQRMALTHLIQIASNMCCFINADTGDQLLHEVQQNVDAFLQEIIRMFACYNKDEMLLPVSEELQFYVDALLFIFQTLSLGYRQKIFSTLMAITVKLLKNKCDEVDLFLELICYFISVAQPNSVKVDLQAVEKEYVVNIFNRLRSYENSYISKANLEMLIDQFKT